MSNRRIGAVLILSGVPMGLGAVALVMLGGSVSPEAVDLGEKLSALCLAMVGLGTALLGISGHVFGRTLARRSLKLLAVGLIGDAVLLALAALPGLEGWRVMVLFVPFFVIGWATAIGLVLTVVALVAAGGRPRIVGGVFLAAPLLLLVSSVFPYRPGAPGGAMSPFAIGFSVAAGCAVVL